MKQPNFGFASVKLDFACMHPAGCARRVSLCDYYDLCGWTEGGCNEPKRGAAGTRQSKSKGCGVQISLPARFFHVISCSSRSVEKIDQLSRSHSSKAA